MEGLFLNPILHILAPWSRFEKCVFFSKTSTATEWGRERDRVSYFGPENVTEAMTNQLCFHGFATGRRQRREEKVAVIQFKLP